MPKQEIRYVLFFSCKCSGHVLPALGRLKHGLALSYQVSHLRNGSLVKDCGLYWAVNRQVMLRKEKPEWEGFRTFGSSNINKSCQEALQEHVLVCVFAPSTPVSVFLYPSLLYTSQLIFPLIGLFLFFLSLVSLFPSLKSIAFSLVKIFLEVPLS